MPSDADSERALQSGTEALVEGRYSDALDAYAIARRASTGRIVANAIVNLGVTHGYLCSYEQAIAIYTELEERFEKETDPEIRTAVALGISNKGVELTKLGRHEEAASAFESVIARYGDSPEQCQVVNASLFGLSLLFLEKGRFDEAITASTELLGQFGADADPAFAEQAGRALVDRGSELADRGRMKEALAMYDGVIEALDSDSEAHRKVAGAAMLNKAAALESQGRYNDAFTIYQEILELFDLPSDDPLVLRITGEALVNIGVKQGQVGHSEDALVTLDAALGFTENSLEPDLRHVACRALCNKGTTLQEMDRHKEAIETFDSALNYLDSGSPDAEEVAAQVKKARMRSEKPGQGQR